MYWYIRIPAVLLGVIAAIFAVVCMVVPTETLNGKTYHESLTGIGLLGGWVYPAIFVGGILLAVVAATWEILNESFRKPDPDPEPEIDRGFLD